MRRGKNMPGTQFLAWRDEPGCLCFDRPRATAAQRFAALCLVAGVCFAMPGYAQDEKAGAGSQNKPVASLQLEEIRVIGIAPSHGALASDSLPFSVQTFSADDLAKPSYYSVADALTQRAGSVTINNAQNNRLQPDLQFRGFTASPLLGLSQGVAVYQNGVRVNEAFGDTVNWDLMPSNSVETMDIVAGSNPVYGLNALGGALLLKTRTGFSAPDASLALTAGSFATRDVAFSQGGNNGEWGYFVATQWMQEEGWRDFSDSDAANVYAALSWRGANQELDLYLNGANTELRGNGAVPIDLLEADRAAVFTHADITENELMQLSASFRRWWSESTELNINTFIRRIDIQSFNGDGTEFSECGEVDDDRGNPGLIDDGDASEENPLEGFLCDEDDLPVRDQRGALVSDDFNAMNNRSRREQTSYGLTAQLLLNRSLYGRDSQVIIGADYFEGSTGFSSNAEFSRLLPNRGTTPSGRFDADGNVILDADQRTWGIFVSNALSLSDRIVLSLSARFNNTQVDNVDPTGENPDLEGSHNYQRLNGGVGLQFDVTDRLSTYASLQRTSRAPSPVELACSEPDAPCNLPNSFLADPPLDDVVASSLELGVRGSTELLSFWRIGAFYNLSRDDILFQTTGGVSSNEGFFQNAADTLRRGVELELRGGDKTFDWYLNYTYLKATFDSPFVSSSPNNPAATDGQLLVRSGSDIPGLPDHNLKLGGEMQLAGGFSVGANLRAASGQYLRGDEANIDRQTPGYAVIDLSGALRMTERVRVIARVENVFDREYETFGLYGEADEVLEDVEDESGRFLGPAAPRTYWLSVALDW